MCCLSRRSLLKKKATEKSASQLRIIFQADSQLENPSVGASLTRAKWSVPKANFLSAVK